MSHLVYEFAGYKNYSLTDKIEKIEIHGYMHKRKWKAKTFVLIRAAEYSREQGKSYFFLFKSLNDVASFKPCDEVNRATRVSGMPAAFGYVMPLDEYQSGAISAQETLKSLNPKTKNN